MKPVLHIGLLINPLAGLGGALARKGSDGAALRDIVQDMPEAQRQRASERARRALQVLRDKGRSVEFSCWAGDMGADLLAQMGFPAQVLGRRDESTSSAQDTRLAATHLQRAGIDLLLLAGGDGTARDILDVIDAGLPVLGIPAGVKMHSGVFAVSPEAAGELLAVLADAGLVGLRTAEVRDIDEEAFRHDTVRSRYYGELLVPAEGRFLQHTKIGGREDPELVAADIAAWVADTVEEGRLYLLGPGSTTAAIKQQLGISGTLLGVDVVRDGALLLADASEEDLLQLLESESAPASVIVTPIGGQGHIFGRGNQQLSAAVLRRVGTENVLVIAAKSKIAALQGRPLLVDSNDPELDLAMRGYRMVTTGYDDHVLYPVGFAGG
ncbi:MAG: ATP-NAD kinase family protein [Halioglobus sp.]|nr:ATP-NAD kinase family protein [Halioglobus sp.]